MDIAQTRLDILLIFAYAYGVFILAGSIRARKEGLRIGGALVIPAAAGIALIVLLLVLFFDDSVDLLGRSADGLQAIAVTVAVVFIAIAVGDMVLNRLVDIALVVAARSYESIARRSLNLKWIPDITRLLLLGISIIVVLGGGFRLQPTGGDVKITAKTEATYALPKAPTALVFRGEYDGYIAFGEGQIARFELPRQPEGELVLETVAKDISYPHGLAILDDTLYVTEQGPFDCNDTRAAGAFAGIRCAKLPGMSVRDSQIQILESTRGGVIAFDISQDGTLQNRRSIVTDLPVSTGDHAVNGIVVGPDKRLYVAIGSLDVLVNEDDLQEILESIERPNLDLIGSIISFEPDGSSLEVYASGLRNVYGLTMDEKGRLYGVDNNGLTARDWRKEEVLQIKRGANYGYPYEGSFGDNERTTDDPIWFLDGVGSSGIEWAGNLGLDPGLIIGSRNKVTYLTVDEDEEGVYVGKRGNSSVLLEPKGFVTFVKAMPEQRLAIGVFGLRPGEHALILLDVKK